MKVSRKALTSAQVKQHNANVIRVILVLKAAGNYKEANMLIDQYIILV